MITFSFLVLALFFCCFADAIVQITHNEGVGALWSGTFASLLLATNPAIQFTIYEGLKRQLTWSIPRGVSEAQGAIRWGLGLNS